METAPRRREGHVEGVVDERRREAQHAGRAHLGLDAKRGIEIAHRANLTEHVVGRAPALEPGERARANEARDGPVERPSDVGHLELREHLPALEALETDDEIAGEVLDVALELSGAKPLASAASVPEEPDLACFTLPDLGPGWEATLDSVRPLRRRDEAPWEWRARPLLPIVFDAPAKLGTPVAHLHLAPPVVQRLLSRLLSQGYAAHDMSRITVVRPKEARSRVLAFARVSVFGEGAVRLHDDLIGVAARFRSFDAPLTVASEDTDREAVRSVEQFLADSTPLRAVPKTLQEQVKRHAAAHFAALWPSLDAEADAVLHTVERDLARRGREEAEALTRILDAQAEVAQRALYAMAKTDRKTLDAKEREQLDDERAYLERRLRALPEERAREVKALEDHYRVLQRRVERVGLVYVLPQTLG